MKSLFLSTLLFSVACLAQIEIQLVANWENPPFELRLLETIASENETYYLPVLSKIATFSIDEDEIDEDPELERTDKELYECVFGLLTPVEKSLYDIPLANKYYTPRVISHFKYYNETALPKFKSNLEKKCCSVPNTWLQYNDEVYCNPDDVYALMTDGKRVSDEEILLPFDRIIGESGPILVLYGDPKDKCFKKFISNLYESSKDGKFRFVWRYVSQNPEQREVLTGYGVDLTLKRTDYIVTDIRENEQKVLRAGKERKADGDEEKETHSFLNKYATDIEPVSNAALEKLDIKLSSFVLSTENHAENFKKLKRIISELPKFAADLVNEEIDEELLEQVEYNAQIGLVAENSALFVNGAPLDETSQNVFGLYSKIKQELSFINAIKSLGFDSATAKDLLGKFSLYSMFKKAGQSTNRYLIESDDSPVIYFNDIETDVEYSKLPNDLSVYMKRHRFGEMPPLRQNVHTTVLAINLGNRKYLKILDNVFNAVMANGIPQRIGVIPLIDTEEDALLANNLFHIVETKGVRKAFKYIRKLIENDKEASPKALTDKDYVSELVKPFLKNFDIEKPYIIANGVFHPLDSDWPYSITRQITEDVQHLTGLIHNKKVSDPEELAEALYFGAKKLRNSLVLPDDASLVDYKTISADFLKSLSYSQNEIIELSRENKDNGMDHATLTLGGDLGSRFTLEQLLEILKYASKTEANLRIRVINQSDGATFIGTIKQALNESIEVAIEHIQELLKEHEFAEFEQNKVIGDLLKSIDITDKDFLLLNGRYIKLDKVLDSKILDFFIENEFDTRLSLAEGILKKRDFVPTIYNFQDWFEVFSSVLTKTFYVEQTSLHKPENSRFDFSNAKTDKSISFGDKSTSDIHILLTIDPAQELAQRLVYLIDAVKDIPFVSIDILLQPQTAMEELKVKRFYKGNVQPRLQFNRDGSLKEFDPVSFENVPEKTLFTLDLDVHSRWIVVPKESPSDLDNVLLEQSGPVVGVYELENVLIEGNAFIDQTLEAPTGLSVQVEGSDTNVMTLFGYLQLKANPGLWNFRIKEGRSFELFDLLSIESLRDESREVHESFRLGIFDLDGLHTFPRVVKKPGKENKNLIIGDNEEVEENEVETKSKAGLFSNLLGLEKKPKNKKADINIFTIASGHLYERLLSIMTASVMKQTTHTVKFWLIDNYMSPTFRKFLPHLAEKYGFDYELITYKWPSWLIGQREKQRTIWGYKILFLDVLFPQDLDKVIFVDADQIVRTDMIELVNLDLEGAPYGYTPMGDSRKEMEDFRFWKKGYWSNYLGDKFKYHISALYVIDLKKFRQVAAGDRLRQHYALLSKDPNSLSNLDQDLPNNLQHQLRIFSLPQEWLWCETWCDDESLKTAKTIDLCNNPLTKEHKLDRARRLIPEWNVYDEEIKALHSEVFGEDVDEDDALEDDVLEKVEIDREQKEHFAHDEL